MVNCAASSRFSFYARSECHKAIVCGLVKSLCLQLTQIPQATRPSSIGNGTRCLSCDPVLGENSCDQNSHLDGGHSHALYASLKEGGGRGGGGSLGEGEMGRRETL